jgi:WD40 repeat protein
MLELSYDLRRFVAEFDPLIQMNPIHLYFSGLPYAPKSSTLFKIFANVFKDQILSVLSGSPTRWNDCLAVMQSHPGETPDISIAFSADGALMASTASITSDEPPSLIRLWDGFTGAAMREFRSDDCIYSLSFVPGGLACLGSSSGIRDLTNGALTSKFTIGTTAESQGKPPAIMALSVDGTLMASSHGVLYNTATGARLNSPVVGRTETLTNILFSRDGSRLISVSKGSIRLWDVVTGNQIKILRQSIRNVPNIASGPSFRILPSHTTG